MSLPPDDDRVELIPPPKGGPPVFLRRGKRARGGAAVLLIHGASASCDTFLAPRGSSFFDYLSTVAGLDVWLLDWRGSFYNADQAPLGGTLDDVARVDIPYAIEHVRSVRREEKHDTPLTVLGHCVGAASLAMAVGAGHVKRADVARLIFSTIGLFYEVTWDGWTKVQDRILERVADANPTYRAISPAVTPWPDAMEKTYALWPKTWGPPWGDDHEKDPKTDPALDEFFRRLSFLFGQCFLVSNLDPKMDQAAIRKQFGSVPFKVYRHAAQNALRGFAARFDAEGRIDNPNTPNDKIAETVAKDYLDLDRFRGFAEITLITGADNPLWHRDSVDRMAEWLARRGEPLKKIVLDGYGHQDLWWGHYSWSEVFPLLF